MEHMHKDVYTYAYVSFFSCMWLCVCICIYIKQRWGPECEKEQKIFKSIYKNIFISAIFSPFSKFWFFVIFKSFGPWTRYTSPNTSFSSIAVCLGAHTLAASCEELTHWKRVWCWEGLGAGGEGDDRGWDGWLASLVWWTWVWVNSGRWWWTGRPGVLRCMGSQRVGHDWATELNCVFWLFQLESKIVILMYSSCLFTFFHLSFSQMLVFFFKI